MSDNPIDPSRVLVWLHTWHGRDGLRDATVASVEASDAKNRFEIMRQPEGADRDDYYMRVLSDLANRADIDWMLRIEDDALVNRHLLHNVCRWKAINDPLFGAGWLSVTDDLLADHTHCGTRNGFRTREYKECHFAGGVLMRTALLKRAIPMVEERLPGLRFAPGCGISNAVWRADKRVFFHTPAIVFIDMGVPTYHGPTRSRWKQPYEPDWKAP